MILLYALWVGALWRIRGGAWETLLGLPPRTTLARAVTSALIALPLVFSMPGTVAPLLGIGVGLMAGMALAGWGDAMDIGRVAGTRWDDAAAMSGWGVVVVLPAAVVSVLLDGVAWPLVLAGVLFGPIYALAWHLPRLPRVAGFAAGPTEWAEVACGAAIGAALWLAVP